MRIALSSARPGLQTRTPLTHTLRPALNTYKNGIDYMHAYIRIAHIYTRTHIHKQITKTITRQLHKPEKHTFPSHKPHKSRINSNI